MLVLTRKMQESLLIGENIVITVLAIEGDKVKLGIKAPKNLAIYRQEVLQAIKEENAAAAAVTTVALQDILDLFQDKPIQDD